MDHTHCHHHEADIMHRIDEAEIIGPLFTTISKKVKFVVQVLPTEEERDSLWDCVVITEYHLCQWVTVSNQQAATLIYNRCSLTRSFLKHRLGPNLTEMSTFPSATLLLLLSVTAQEFFFFLHLQEHAVCSISQKKCHCNLKSHKSVK